MSTSGIIVPFKTPEGQDELARRTRRLGQRHRTLLLLVDGRRSVDQVLALGVAAGVAESHFGELLAMGLLALPDRALGAPSLAEPPDADDGPASVFHVELPIDDAAREEEPALVEQGAAPQPPVEPGDAAATAARVALSDSSAPDPDAAATAGVEPAESVPAESVPADSTSSEFAGLDAATPPHDDRPLEEARAILMRALRAEAPLVGQLTLLKVKRASDRAELEGLLDEVEARISAPRKRAVAAQTVRHVRHLLGTPTSTSFTLL